MMAIRKNFDPFNHGTTNISYKEVQNERFRELSRILEKGWNILDIESIGQVYESAEKSSNNYRVKSKDYEYLLKESKINSPRTQDLVNRCVSYCHKNEVPTPNIVPTISNKTYFPKDKTYCLYDFIDGEHFDGSRFELKETAKELAELHKTLLNIPYTKEIIRDQSKGKKIKHSKEDLRDLINYFDLKIKSKSNKSELDELVIKNTDNLRSVSKNIENHEMQKLPLQVIHYDLHPHNLLFDNKSRELLAFIDFDPMRYSQRARDVSFGMHRLSRTYGKKTERKKDAGSDIRDRAGDFLKEYIRINKLDSEEIKSISVMIEDESLSRIINILKNHYFNKEETWSFDLKKQIITLSEGQLFNFD